MMTHRHRFNLWLATAGTIVALGVAWAEPFSPPPPSETKLPGRAPASVQQTAPPAYYNELFDADGSVRPQYRKVYEIYSRLTPEQKRNFALRSEKDFLGDQALDVLPRIFTQSEYRELSKGVEQRGNALRMFLEDYYGGGSKWKTVIPPDALERIIERSGETAYKGKVNPRKIVFPYGPDIIRDNKGIWRVLEDNPGNIGGPGDIVKGREILLARMKQYRQALDIQDDPAQYFKNLISRYKSLMSEAPGKPPGKPSEKMVLYTLSLAEQSDKEDVRLRKLMKDQGVEYVTPASKEKKLRVKPDGVYLERKASGAKTISEKVGFLIINADHKDLDYSHAATRLAALLDEAEAHLDSYDSLLKARQPGQSIPQNLTRQERTFYEWGKRIPKDRLEDGRNRLERALSPDPRTGKVDEARLRHALSASDFSFDLPREVPRRTPGLIQAILDGKVETNYTPGLDFIGDKEFTPYVEDLVKLYLGEEPILKNVPAKSFAKKDGSLDQEFFREVFENQNKYVIKPVDGRGGDGIQVGPKVSREEFESAKAAILKEPRRFQAQEYKALSVLDDRIVDSRLLSFVHPKGVDVGPTPWGRAISMHGDGKVNISASGFESPAIIVPDPVPNAARCVTHNVSRLLAGAAQ